MQDSQVSLCSTLAWVCWAAAWAIIVANLFTDHHIGGAGMALAAAGGTLHVRSMFCQQAQALRSAFELGREVGLSEAVPPDDRVTRMR